MPLINVPADDPRCQLTAYVSKDGRLYEVVDDTRGVLVLENARTEQRLTVTRITIAAYKLERPALSCPDRLSQPELEAHP